MRVSKFTRECLAYRRQERDLKAKGYERIADNGHPLWEMDRGGRTHCRIVDSIISVDGKTVYIKIEPRDKG